MTGAKSFIDTNVLLRAIFVGMPLHAEAAKLIFSQRESGSELWISRQVIREFLVQVTREQKSIKPMDSIQLEKTIVFLETNFQIADETSTVTARLLQLIKQYPIGGKQIHDANIVATMLVNGIDTLLTQNIDDMKRFEKEITLIPLKADGSS